MNKKESLFRLTLFAWILAISLVSFVWLSVSRVQAHTVMQEENITPTFIELTSETPTESVINTFTEIPTEYIVAEPTMTPTFDIISLPTETTDGFLSQIPPEITAEFPTVTADFDSTATLTLTPTNLPTETTNLTPTPETTETLVDNPLSVQDFRWDLEIKLNNSQFSRIQSDAGFQQYFSDNQISFNLTDQSLQLSGNNSLEQVRNALFEGLGSTVDFLGGPAEINIYLLANSGDEIIVSLESRLISGYSWVVSPEQGSNLRHSFPPMYGNSNGSETEIVHFTSSESGDGTINLVYRRPFGPTAEMHAILNIRLPEPVPSIDLSDPNPNEIQAIAQSELETASDDLFEGIAQSVPPSEWDWRDLGVVSDIRDQGSCGSCWAFATVGIMESAMRIANENPVDLSEQFLVSCNNDGWDCDGGSVAHKYHKSTVARLQSVSGAVLESDMPYEATNGACQLIANHPYQLSNWGFISSSYYTVPNVSQIKNAIYTYGPITAGICAGDHFQEYSGGVFSTSDVCTSTNSHIINLVGWNDAEQYWILRNSWGEYWGENGYMRIKWGTSNVGYGASWVIYNVANAIPSPPTLLSPVSSAIFNNTTPSLSWNGVANANNYQVQVSKASAFSSPAVDVVTASGITNYTLETPLTGDGIWFWRVRAFDAKGRDGDWSSIKSFTLDTTPPTKPNLSVPLDGATPIGIPTFSWAAVTSANAYQFEIAETDGFLDPLISTPDGTVAGQPAITTLKYKPFGLIAGKPYFWHARARDAVGNWGDWSIPRTLIVQTSLPEAPVISSPLSGFLANSQPAMTWKSVTGGITYQIQIANTSTFTGTVLEDRTKEPYVLTHTVETPLTDGIWYWRVRAWNATNGPGAWSKAFSFRYDIIPPLAPVLTYPKAEALVRTTPSFTWGTSTTANAYQFEYGTASSGTIETYSSIHTSPVLTSKTYTPPTMEIYGYYWRVRARDAAGNWGLWSDIRKINIYPSKLSGPGLISPAANAYLNTLSPIFTWGSVTGGLNYTIQISRLSNFSLADDDTDTVWLPDGVFTYDAAVEPLSREGLWYWRVSTTNATYEMGPWTSARTFTVDITPPGKPVLKYPLNNAPGIRTIPTFSWKAVKGANAYQFQLADNTNFENPLLTTPGKDIPGIPQKGITFKPAEMDLLIPYYWHVRARDIAGNWGEWSEPQTITILPTIPSAPALLEPVNGLITNNITPRFAWGAVSNGNIYQIQIDKTSTFASPDRIDHSGEAGELSFTADPIIANTLYYWRVRGINKNNEAGTWSSVRKFTIDTIPPAAPILSSPANDITNFRGIPTFNWKSVSGANAYQFEYDENLDFSSPILTTPGKDVTGTPLAGVSFKPSTLDRLTPFYWHVRARDIAGNWGDWSETWRVTILPMIPAAPVLLSPPKGGITNDTTPSFGWNPVVDGNTYRVQVDNLSTFASPEADNTGESGVHSWTLSTPFTTDGIYYWRVQAINILNESGSWSSYRAFTQDTVPPLAPNLLLPVNDAPNVHSIPTFSWGTSTGANAYQFQIDNDEDFSSPTITTPGLDGTISGTPLTGKSYKPPDLEFSKPYFWRVRARDAAENWGLWSESRKIYISTP